MQSNKNHLEVTSETFYISDLLKYIIQAITKEKH